MLWRVSLNLLEHSLQRFKEIFSFLPICVSISSLARCEHPKNSQTGIFIILEYGPHFLGCNIATDEQILN